MENLKFRKSINIALGCVGASFMDSESKKETIETLSRLGDVLDIYNIVMKYAEKHKDCWGIEESVSQVDSMMVDAINLFTEIIGALPEQEEEE